MGSLAKRVLALRSLKNQTTVSIIIHDSATDELDHNGNRVPDELVGLGSDSALWYTSNYSALAHFFLKPKFTLRDFGPFNASIEFLSNREAVASKSLRYEIMAVKNVGKRTAESVRVLVHFPEADLKEDLLGMVPLLLVQPLGTRTHSHLPLRLDWTEKHAPETDFDFLQFFFVQKGKRQVTLNPATPDEGLGEIFVFFVTIKDSKTLYFPVETSVTVEMPTTFYVDLYITAKDQKLSEPRAFEIKATKWDSIEVRLLAPGERKSIKTFHSVRAYAK